MHFIIFYVGENYMIQYFYSEYKLDTRWISKHLSKHFFNIKMFKKSLKKKHKNVKKK